MYSFPSSEERTVASAMLLLHTIPPSFSTPKFYSNFNDEVPEERRSSSISRKRFRESSFFSDSDKSSSSCSLLINDDGDSSDKDDEIKSLPVSFFSATARYHQMKFKVDFMYFVFFSIARKSRSKVMWTSSSCSGDWKPNLDTTVKVSPVSVSGEATSCLSNNSSGITSARSLRYANRSRCTSVMENEMERVTPPPAKQRRSKNYVGTPHLRRRGEAILKFLALGGSSELRIREMLGDSPDTSKALRMLLRVDAVKRSGSGGRHDPFVYTITGS
ncbi:uncharacterized protein [Cicer arietinum]|uniref:uncharacterized protein n=1 Tax=Cicer arietinum TaxID=3827 RepID=UPI003CC594EF